MDIMAHAKFRLMLTLIFGIWAFEPPPLGPLSPPSRAWRTTEKAGPDRVKMQQSKGRKGPW